jgi:hypothetical protein
VPPPDIGLGPETSFYTVLTAALNDILDTGYVSAERVAEWVRRLRGAAARSLTPPDVLERALHDTMRAIYRSKVERGGLLKYHPGVGRFTLQRVAPRLRGELDRRILASAALIKLNREKVIEDTLRRFAGWATSIPAGGTDAADRVELKERIRKPLASAPFETRRVIIDQGHKLRASLSEILATDGGALVGHWRSHYQQRGYDYRPEHKHFDVDDKYFVVPDNWALRAGLMKVDGHRYITDIERPGEKPFCRCWYVWTHSLNRLPDGMLTAKGREAVAHGMKMAA